MKKDETRKQKKISKPPAAQAAAEKKTRKRRVRDSQMAPEQLITPVMERMAAGMMRGGHCPNPPAFPADRYEGEDSGAERRAQARTEILKDANRQAFDAFRGSYETMSQPPGHMGMDKKGAEAKPEAMVSITRDEQIGMDIIDEFPTLISDPRLKGKTMLLAPYPSTELEMRLLLESISTMPLLPVLMPAQPPAESLLIGGLSVISLGAALAAIKFK